MNVSTPTPVRSRLLSAAGMFVAAATFASTVVPAMAARQNAGTRAWVTRQAEHHTRRTHNFEQIPPLRTERS